MKKLTKKVIENVQPDIKKPIYLWDSVLSGFGIKVLASGKRRYVVQYRVGSGRSAKQRWQTIGTHGILTCEQARNDARQILAAVARGEDPQGRKVDQT